MQRQAFETRLFFGDAWHAGASRTAVLDKFSREPAWHVDLPGPEHVEKVLAAADRAHRAGAPEPFARAAILERAIDIVAGRGADFRYLMAVEAGFPARDADMEVERCLETLRLSAIAARQLAGEMVPMSGVAAGKGRMGFTLRFPVGPVLAITPFNSPLNTVTHKVAPAFAAGNPVILKPSLHTPCTAALLTWCLKEAGVPDGFLALLHGAAETADMLIADERIRFITFTGSTAVGREIQARAGLRRTQMELGSIASTVVCADADLDAAIPKIVGASFRKAGQVCSSIQHLYVHRDVFDRVSAAVCEGGAALRIGDPKLAETDVGPLVSVAAAEKVEAFVADARERGATVLLEGRRDGACLTPTVLTDVTSEMRLGCEEAFGPVVALLPFDDFGTVVERINQNRYGLACGVFTRDLGIVGEAMTRIAVGGLHINETSSSRVDIMPYGGVKDSGFGHEGPGYAAREMTEERLVTLRL